MAESETFTIALSWPVRKEVIERYHGYVASPCRIVSPKSREPEDLIQAGREADRTN